MSLQIAQCGGEAQLVETQWTEQTLTAMLCSALGLDLVVCGWFLPGGRTELVCWVPGRFLRSSICFYSSSPSLPKVTFICTVSWGFSFYFIRSIFEGRQESKLDAAKALLPLCYFALSP